MLETNHGTTKKRKSDAKESSAVEPKRTKETATDTDYYPPNDSPATTNITISHLPVELLASVVRQCDIRNWKRLELVNGQFRDAVLAAWQDLRSVRLQRVFGYLTDDQSALGREKFRERSVLRRFLETLAARSPFIVELGGLSLFGDQWSPLVVQQICRFEKLERLDLSKTVLVSDMVERLLLSCSKIRYLNLSGCLESIWEGQQLSKTIQEALPRMNLQELIYRNNRFNNGLCLSRMNCDQLTSLDVSGSKFDSDVLKQLLFRTTKLTRLDLSATLDEMEGLHKDDVFAWLSTAERLISFKLNGSQRFFQRKSGNVSESQLHRSVSDLGSFGVLTELEMIGDWYCTEGMLKVITDRLANSLKILRFDIQRCREDSLLVLASRMRNLEVLVFYSERCRRNTVGDRLIYSIAKNLSKLRTLHLDHTSASADALKSLIKLENLRDLTVVGAFNDHSLIAIASALGHRLISLNLPKSNRITDDGLVIAAIYLHNLRRLDLEKSNISDRSLAALARSCSQLQSLNLGKCRNISTEGAQMIVDSCLKLDELCLCVTPVDVLLLKKYARKSCFSKRISSDAVLDITTPDTIVESLDSCYDDQYKVQVLLSRDRYCI